jgi:manganese transport protein
MAGATDDDVELKDNTHTEGYSEPPEKLSGILKVLGPSFAIAAVTVGSGELIATTAAGARVGIVALWFLIISLIIKIGLQYEISRYGLVANETPHAIFDKVPGKIRGHSWAYWWVVLNWIIVENLLYVGVFFGAGVLFHYLTLQIIPLQYATLVVLAITIIPALRGYDFVEDLATVVVLSLVVLTTIGAGLTFFSPYALSMNEIAYGLSFNLPSGGIAVLLAVIGITGIAPVELIGYAHYVQETGYGKLAGPRNLDGWRERMEGWLRVMKIDVVASLILMMITTVAFFIIGSTVVAALGEYPSGPQLAVYLGRAYRNLFGAFGYWLLIIGGFFALYSTLFGKLQILVVAWPDWISQTNWGAEIDNERISTTIAIGLPIIWYLGGFVSNLITPLVLLGASLSTLLYIPEIATTVWILRNDSEQPEELRSTGRLRIGVWLSIVLTFILVASVVLLSVI